MIRLLKIIVGISSMKFSFFSKNFDCDFPIAIKDDIERFFRSKSVYSSVQRVSNKQVCN